MIASLQAYPEQGFDYNIARSPMKMAAVMVFS